MHSTSVAANPTVEVLRNVAPAELALRYIADYVDAARLDREVPVLQLANQTGMSRSSLIRKLKGLTDFTIDELFDVTEFLDVDFEEMLRHLPRRAA